LLNAKNCAGNGCYSGTVRFKNAGKFKNIYNLFRSAKVLLKSILLIGGQKSNDTPVLLENNTWLLIKIKTIYEK
jgi:hypothetical protein